MVKAFTLDAPLALRDFGWFGAGVGAIRGGLRLVLHDYLCTRQVSSEVAWSAAQSAQDRGGAGTMCDVSSWTPAAVRLAILSYLCISSYKPEQP